ncbi:hypothetical protein K461DRAFT_275945 [Myriangium duriaei CBS 260.36]|uniref:Uncharacterized protein n=1 Tax=Myriangium duriaei CBS 260.36 TaxID=1168546 RepID=A0A9P4J646_9PEZI|nr:hypothetical protein K461DRAFT_275945 [Myriangium duriaei CBS 260.36]
MWCDFAVLHRRRCDNPAVLPANTYLKGGMSCSNCTVRMINTFAHADSRRSEIVQQRLDAQHRQQRPPLVPRTPAELLGIQPPSRTIDQGLRPAATLSTPQGRTLPPTGPGTQGQASTADLAGSGSNDDQGTSAAATKAQGLSKRRKVEEK